MHIKRKMKLLEGSIKLIRKRSLEANIISKDLANWNNKVFRSKVNLVYSIKERRVHFGTKKE